MSKNTNELELLKDLLHKKLQQLEELERNIQSLFPKKLDARNAFVFEQRLKAAAELYRLQLSYIQEIARLTERIEKVSDGDQMLIDEIRKQIRNILVENVPKV